MTNPLFDITLIAGGFAHPRPDLLDPPAGGEPPRTPKPSLFRRVWKWIARKARDVRSRLVAAKAPSRDIVPNRMCPAE